MTEADAADWAAKNGRAIPETMQKVEGSERAPTNAQGSGGSVMAEFGGRGEGPPT